MIFKDIIVIQLHNCDPFQKARRFITYKYCIKSRDNMQNNKTDKGFALSQYSYSGKTYLSTNYAISLLKWYQNVKTRQR